MFGGANLESPMGLEHMRAFPFIDYAVSGSADATFPALLTCLAEGRKPDGMPGVISRCGNEILFAGPAEPFRDLDSNPVPEYETYYDAARRYRIQEAADAIDPGSRAWDWNAIPIESSRGCWWGEKSHCTFCGQNGGEMAFRSKSSERMVAEMDALSQSYGGKKFMVCDNVMDMKYISGLFGTLGKRNDGYQIGFEVKSNLTREQVRLMAKGGVTQIQPGIESLNSHILKLFRKGVAKLQNVNVLRWCTYYGIGAFWNLLYGIPGETREDYEDELKTLRLLSFVWPPSGFHGLGLHRFSPNFDDEHLFPTKWRRPHASYSYIYPPHVNLDETVHCFDYEIGGEIVPLQVHAETNAFLMEWRSDWFSGQRPTLAYRRTGSRIDIVDTRSRQAGPRSYTLDGLDAAVYEACNSAPRTPAQACAALTIERADVHPDLESVAAACDYLLDAGLMVSDASKYLSLAIPADPES